MECLPDWPHLLRRPERKIDPERVAAAKERAHARRRVPGRVDRQRERDHLPTFRPRKEPQRDTDVAREDRAFRLAIGVEESDEHDLSEERALTDDVAAVVAKREGWQPKARRWLAAIVCARRRAARGRACA